MFLTASALENINIIDAHAVQRAPSAATWDLANLRVLGGVRLTKSDAASQVARQFYIFAKFQLPFIPSLLTLLLELLMEEGVSPQFNLLDTVVQAGTAQQ